MQAQAGACRTQATRERSAMRAAADGMAGLADSLHRMCVHAFGPTAFAREHAPPWPRPRRGMRASVAQQTPNGSAPVETTRWPTVSPCRKAIASVTTPGSLAMR